MRLSACTNSSFDAYKTVIYFIQHKNKAYSCNLQVLYHQFC